MDRDVWSVLFSVEQERYAQDEKFGQQDHLNLPEWMRGADNAAFGVPTADQARTRCEESFKDGYPNWAEVLVEEVAEALEEVGDDSKLRTELIQVAAVAVAWVEAIDRRAGTQPHIAEERSDGPAPI